MATLLSNGNATGSAVEWGGGQGHFTAEASNWNGATATLQFQTDNDTWLDAGSDTTLTADGHGRFFLPQTNIRIEITVATPTAVYSFANLFGL